MFEQFPIPWREHPISFALRVGYAVRSGEVVAVVQHKIDVARETRLDVFVPGFVMPRCIYSSATGFFGNALKLLDRQAATQGQGASSLSQAEIERGKTVMEPPSLSRTHRPQLRRLIVKNVDRDDRPLSDRRVKGRMIAYAQIIAQPEERRGHVAFFASCGIADLFSRPRDAEPLAVITQTCRPHRRVPTCTLGHRAWMVGIGGSIRLLPGLAAPRRPVEPDVHLWAG